MNNFSQFALTGANSAIQLGLGGNIVVSNTGIVTVYANDSSTLAVTRGAYPQGTTDFATMQYVLDNIQGLNVKAAAQVATTVAGGNISLTGLQTIDGYTTQPGDRVVVKNQSSPSQNGVYNAASGAWSRTSDTSTSADIASAFLFVENGTVNRGTGWVITTPPPITIGSTSITWVQFSAGGSFTAGAGLTLTGLVFSANTSGVSTGIVSNNIVVRSTGTADQVLRSTGTSGAEATWGALNLASSNAVTGVLPVSAGGTGNTGYDTGGMMFFNGLAITTSSSMIYNGSQLTLNLVDNWGGLHIKGRSGGEASIALQPDNVSDGTAGQWILYTNGSNLHNQNDFAFYSSELSSSVFVLQSSTGNLGVGTNNPTSRVTVVGDVRLNGSVLMNGSVSGLVEITTQGNSGTYNFNLPTTAGSSAQVLTSAGGNTSPMTWTSLSTIATSGAITDAAGTLTVGHGGTGQTTLTAHGVLVGAGSSAITQLAAAAAGTVLVGNGTSSDPSFTSSPTLGVNGTTTGKINFASNTLGGNSTSIQAGATTVAWTLTLPTGAGTDGYFLKTDGSGNTSWSAHGAGTVDSGTGGQIAYYATTGTAVDGTPNLTISNGVLTLGQTSSVIGKLILSGNTGGAITIAPQATAGTYNFNLPTTVGSSGQVLTSAAGGSSPMTWTSLATIATSGAITDATGILLVAHGGTGQSSLTNHGVLVGAGTSGITQLTAAPAGTILIGQGATFDPSFSYTPTLGANGSVAGTLTLANGNSSGASVTIQNNNTTSSGWNFNLPTTAGTSGFPLLSGGGGATPMTWGVLQGSAGGTGFGTGNSIAANNIIYTTSTNVWSASQVTNFGLNFVSLSNASQAVTNLNLSNTTIRGIYATIDGGGSMIPTGVKGYVYIPYSGTISSWEIFADQVGSIDIDVWKVPYASFPPTSGNSIAGSQLPVLSAQQSNQNTSLNTWTTTVNAGDVMAFNVVSPSTVTRVNLTIKVLITS